MTIDSGSVSGTHSGADRLTFNGTIIETGTQSYRLAHTLTTQAVS